MSATPTQKKAAPAKKVARKKAVKPAAGNDAPLNDQQKVFVDEYLIDLNATQAAIRAGYSAKTAASIGFENLRKPKIQAAISEAQSRRAIRTGITADRVLQEVARLALYDPRKFFRDDGTPLGVHELDDDTAAALAGMDVHEEYEGSGKDRVFVGYTKKFKLADKGANLERLMKHLGLFKEDNSQKVDPLAALLHTIAGGSGSGFAPIKEDPDHKKE